MKYLGYLLLAVLAYFAIFWNLDYMPIRLWDESRLAINALEMHKNGNYFVTYFDGLPDKASTYDLVAGFDVQSIWSKCFYI